MPTLSDLEAKYLFADPVDPNTPKPHNRIFSGVRSKVTAIHDGDNYFHRLEEVMKRTQGQGDAIYIAGWAFVNSDFKLGPNSVTKLKDLLVEKHFQNVDVRLIFWSEEFVPPFKTAGFRYVKVPFIQGLVQTMEAVLEMRHYNPDNALESPLLNRVVLDVSGPEWGLKAFFLDGDDREVGKWNSHHQKTVVVVAPDSSNPGRKSIHGFVGGMDLNHGVESDTAHVTNGWHDLAAEVQGEAAIAVFDNFRTRWREAISTTSNANLYAITQGLVDKTKFVPDDVLQDIPEWTDPIPDMPDAESARNSVQLVQTFAKAHEWDDQTLIEGRETIFQTLSKALSAARRYVYIEGQYVGKKEFMGKPEVVDTMLMLSGVLQRGDVKVILVGSAGASWDQIPAILKKPEFADRLAVWRLDGGVPGLMPSINVHSKLIMIDDEFAMIGSANFTNRSLFADHNLGTDTEISAAIVSEGDWVKNLRVELWKAHLGPRITGHSIDGELRNLDMALGIWRHEWKNAPTHSIPTSLELIQLADSFQAAPAVANRTLLNFLGPENPTP